MANEPRKADENRSKPPRRENDQRAHEGSSHDPSEFDAMNPARTKGKPNSDVQENQ